VTLQKKRGDVSLSGSLDSLVPKMGMWAAWALAQKGERKKKEA